MCGDDVYCTRIGWCSLVSNQSLHILLPLFLFLLFFLNFSININNVITSFQIRLYQCVLLQEQIIINIILMSKHVQCNYTHYYTVQCNYTHYYTEHNVHVHTHILHTSLLIDESLSGAYSSSSSSSLEESAAGNRTSRALGATCGNTCIYALPLSLPLPPSLLPSLPPPSLSPPLSLTLLTAKEGITGGCIGRLVYGRKKEEERYNK